MKEAVEPRSALVRRTRDRGRERALAFVAGAAQGSTVADVARLVGDAATQGVVGGEMRREALRGAADALAEVVKILRQDAAG